MKITAFILSLYVLFLACLPAVASVEIFQEDLCCVDICLDSQEAHEEKSNDDCGDLCNPFLSCQCSLGFTSIAVEHATFLDFSQYCIRNSSAKELSPSQITFSVWHPPRT